MEKIENQSMSPEEARELYNAWNDRYIASLEEFASRENGTLEELVDLIWEKGILDHLAPIDDRERQARVVKKRDLFDRDNTDFLWRIMYSGGSAQEIIEKNMTAIGGYSLGSILQAIHVVVGNQDLWKKLFPGGYDKLTDHPEWILTEAIIERAKKELRDRGVEPHENFIPIGSSGEFRGIPVTVERYSHNGLVVLGTKDPESWNKLGQEAKDLIGEYSSAIPPQYLDPKDFTTKKSS